MQNRDQLLQKIADLMSKSDEFKQFHGKVEFNFAFGEVKNYNVNETFLRKKKK